MVSPLKTEGRRGRGLIAVLGFVVGGAFAATASTGCSSAAEVLVSPEQENMLGAQIKTELETKEMVKYLSDPDLSQYILGLANKVVEIGKQERKEFTWQTNVIDDPSQVNAFATPGGYLYVYTGLVRAADNEAEVIGVMGHEVGHVLARHFARRLVAANGLQTVIALALGQDPGLLSQVATEIATAGVLLRNSRDAEREADRYGAELTAAAGYDPNGLATFFRKLSQMRGQTPALLTYLSTHPDPAERAVEIEAYIKEKKLSGANLGTEKFQMMRGRIPAPAPVGDAGVRSDAGASADAR